EPWSIVSGVPEGLGGRRLDRTGGAAPAVAANRGRPRPTNRGPREARGQLGQGECGGGPDGRTPAKAGRGQSRAASGREEERSPDQAAAAHAGWLGIVSGGRIESRGRAARGSPAFVCVWRLDAAGPPGVRRAARAGARLGAGAAAGQVDGSLGGAGGDQGRGGGRGAASRRPGGRFEPVRSALARPAPGAVRGGKDRPPAVEFEAAGRATWLERHGREAGVGLRAADESRGHDRPVPGGDGPSSERGPLEVPAGRGERPLSLDVAVAGTP